MKKTVLVIDDEERARVKLKAFLSEEGHRVLTAKNYLSAVSAISRNAPDLVITDIVLDGKTGADILAFIEKKGMHCPAVMIAGKPEAAAAAESKRRGAYDILSRPVRKADLIRVAGRALDYKALLDENRRLESEKAAYRKRLDAVYRSVRDAVITVDDRMKIIEINDAAERVFGKPRQRLIRRSLRTQLPDILTPVATALKETLDHGRIMEDYRIEARGGDRGYQVYSAASAPLTDDGGKVAGAVLAMRDMTRLNILESELKERRNFHRIIGKSPKMQEIYRFIESMSDIDATVLLCGESGAGKEIAARAIHDNSPRAAKPLVSVSCAGLNEKLLESELFGHVKGAFTGAVGNRIGRIEAARQGTLFLDGIGELSPAMQGKLLRVLDEEEFERAGDSRPIRADVRIIAAAGRDLRAMVRRGVFREDLFYRLKVFEITLPPLRDRVGDISLLVTHYCERFNHRFQKAVRGVDGDVLQRFMSYDWPGNIRELENALEHAFLLCRQDIIEMRHIPPEIRRIKPPPGDPDSKPSTLEGRDVLGALVKTGWNKARAARLLGVSRQTLYRLIEKHDIQPSRTLT